MKVGLVFFGVLLYCCMGLSAEVDSIEKLQRVTSVFAGMAKQDALFTRYKKRCKQDLQPEPMALCARCSTQNLGLPELLGGIRGTMLRNVLDGVDTYDAMLALVTKTEELFQAGTRQHIVSFILSTAQELPYLCIRCQVACWKAP